VKHLGACALAGLSATGPAFVAGRTSAGVACCRTGQHAAVMR